uniref:Uncharacterized protein n=1 Tax=Glossina palpalis gambiensis TaxID=67801 RepID=A0A1B0BZE2_9MUSC
MCHNGVIHLCNAAVASVYVCAHCLAKRYIQPLKRSMGARELGWLSHNILAENDCRAAMHSMSNQYNAKYTKTLH